MPIKGVVLWNSHAFNLTHQNGRMAAWVNIYFPEPVEQRFEEQQIFNASKIFWGDSFLTFPMPAIPAFEDREVCQLHVFGRLGEPFVDSIVEPEQTVHLFELSGHMHEHGKRFQIFRGAFTCKGGSQAGQPCSPFNPAMCPAGTCTDAGGRDPQAACCTRTTSTTIRSSCVLIRRSSSPARHRLPTAHSPSAATGTTAWRRISTG